MAEPEFLGLDLKAWFTDHPPRTQAHKEKHAKVNALALEAAKVAEKSRCPSIYRVYC